MDLTLAFVAVFISLFSAVMTGMPILYPLIAGLFVFTWMGLRRGFEFQNLCRMILTGMLRPARIYTITLLVGAASAGWMACGTVPYFIRYGIEALNPNLFVVSIFIMTCLISLTLGSSFGTTGVIGVVFMAMAKAGGIHPPLAAGALISAAYFGERSTPLSSCANLIAVLTDSDLYKNIKKLFMGTLAPFMLTVLLYTGFSVVHPLTANFNQLATEIQSLYHLSPWLTLPTLVVFACVLIRIDVRLALLISMLASLAVGFFVQHIAPTDLIMSMLTGFQRTTTGPLSSILKSGGMAGMIKAVLVVITAAGYTGLFEGTQMLSTLQNQIDRWVHSKGRFIALLTTALAGASFGCSQTFAIMTAHQFLKPHYGDSEQEKAAFAEDTGNTALVVAPLIPWNVGASVPAAILATSTAYIPYAFYLYLIPLFMVFKNLSQRQNPTL